MKRTKAAFLLNAQELATNSLYFWTFTFAKSLDVEEARKQWNRLLTRLRKNLPALTGVRVFEMHERHGLHVHLITTRFVHVDAVREVIHRQQKSNWGRIHVVKANKGIGPYLGKYLSKARPECLKGWRMWAALDAKNYNHTRVADVILDSLFASVWQAATRCFGWKGNSRFHTRKSMVMTLSKLCVGFDCVPGVFPAPDGSMRPWDLQDVDFVNWYRFGFSWLVERSIFSSHECPF
jgi:hypothetical protein